MRYNDLTGEWFGLDDLFVAGAGFVLGYVGHGISSGNWGMGAVTSGLTAAGTAWLGYSTAGVSTAGGAITASTWTHVGGMAVNALTSQFLPSFTLPIGDFSIGLSPTIGFGSSGLSLGAGAFGGYNDGNFSFSAGIGTGTGGTKFDNGYWGWTSRATYKGYGVGYGKTNYSKSEIYGQQLGAQQVGTITAYFNYNSFTLSNDKFGDKGDRWRTNAFELTIGKYSFGSYLYTNNGGPDSYGETDESKNCIPPFPVGRNLNEGKSTWTNGRVYAAPAWIGYKNTRIGYSHKIIHNLTQNWVHKGILGQQNYYMNYDNFVPGGYSYSGFNNPFSLWGR